MITGPRKPANSPRAGFTLIELIMVMMVTAMVLALSAPTLRGFFASRKPADAAAEVLSLTKLAHTDSVSHGRRVRLNVDSQSGECWLTAQEGGAYVPVGADAGRRVAMPEGSSIRIQPAGSSGQSAQTYVEFRPSGRSDAASIEIRGAQGELYKVATDSATEPYRVISPVEDGA